MNYKQFNLEFTGILFLPLLLFYLGFLNFYLVAIHGFKIEDVNIFNFIMSLFGKYEYSNLIPSSTRLFPYLPQV